MSVKAEYLSALIPSGRHYHNTGTVELIETLLWN